MAAFAFLNSDVYYGAYDLSAYANKLSGTHTVAQLDATTFASGDWPTRIAGLHDIDASIEGFQDFTTLVAGVTGQDQNLAPLLGGVPQVMTVSETDGSIGAPAEMFKALQVGFPRDYKVGELATFQLPVKGASQWAPGNIGANRVSRTTTASSPGVQLGSPAGRRLFATRHIFAVSGNSPQLATFIESAAAATFAGATTRISFTTATAVGGEWGPPFTGGAVTDPWYRFSWVISGTGTPTFDFAGGFGLI